MKPRQIKSQIKKLTEEFGLKYNPAWFKQVWISKRHARYLEYVGMCTDPIYTRFGKTIERRIDNIDKFENSKEFKKIKNEYSGQAITKSEVIKGIKACKKIKNKNLRKEFLDLHKKILSSLSEGNLALLTETKNIREKETLLKSYLRHEWLHLFLIKNKIYYKSISESYWKYDEGLVTYLEFYIDGKLSKLESEKKKTKYAYLKKYFVYAIKFRELLKDKPNSKARKKVLFDLIKRLK
ncbi:MAG: hypothetical protein KJ600_00855 [Nanoarchaeota archaeon]|nr:hypothetical protein [Nanoarchaeota archaeon]MBU1103092.1 hypothetical protein [Nanoarchaeota archaeon]